MKSKRKRSIAIILIVALTFCSLPDNVFAQEEVLQQSETTADNNDSATTVTNNNDSQELQVLSEDVSKRTLNSKTFIMSDHSYMAVVYNENVHYYEDGKYNDINNTLQYDTAENSNDFDGYETKDNSFQVKFASDAAEDELVRVETDKYKLTWDYSDKDNDIKEKVVDDISDPEQTKEDEFKVENNVSGINYNGIEDGVNLEYQVNGSNVKENIVVKQARDNYTFSFNLDMKNLDAKLNDDGSISVYDSNSVDKEVYHIPAPYMYDADGNTSDAVKYELEKSGDKYILKVVADEKVMNSASFPVTIDPMITTDTDQSAISCSYVSSNHTSENENLQQQLLVGNEKTYYGSTRTYVKFQLPTLNKGDIVVSAKLKLYQYDQNFYSDSVDNLQVNAYAVNEGWSASTLTWANKPTSSSTILDYDYIGRSSGFKTWNITQAVKDWYDGDLENNGIMIKAETEIDNDTDQWSKYGAYGKFSSDKYSAQEEVYPYISINYRNNKGLEDYWTYHEINAGSAGTAYVNDYTGNLVVVHNDVSTPGNLMPVTIQHVYNGYMAGDKYSEITPYVGRGWRLNIEQTIRKSTYFGLTGDASIQYPYVYTDGDGTDHYFCKDDSGNLVDEDGLGLTLTVSNSSFTIKDLSDTVMLFNSVGNLSSITDTNGNKMTITYDGSKITKVTDGAGNVINIAENLETGSGYIRTITDSSGRVTTFYFDAGKLIKILYPDGKYSTYEYDTDGSMTKATDTGGHSMTFGYTSSSKGKRVNSVLEKSSSDVAGQKVTMDYSKYNETIFTTAGEDDDFSNTNDNLLYTYQFDNYGRTTGVKEDTSENMSLGATNYSYIGSSLANTKSNNRLQSQMALGRNTRNYISNGNAEVNSDWKNSSSVDTATYAASYTTSQSYLGNQSLKLDVSAYAGDGRARYYQDFNNSVLVPGSTYTLSAYVKTSNISGSSTGNYGACIWVNSFASSDTILSEYSNYVTGTTSTDINNGWKKLTVTFTVPTGATSSRINLAIRQSTGIAYFDAIQLETGSSANKFNMLENPSMENATSGQPDGWTGTNLTSSDAVSTTYDRVGSYSYKITGDSETDKELVQTVNVVGGEDDTYIVSGWAKANAVSNDSADTRKFKISVKVIYSDGYEVWKSPATFNYTVRDWQYVAQSFDLNDDTTTVRKPVKVEVHIRYFNQENTAYFDDIQLIKDDVPSYSYDSKGNLTSVASNADQKESASYDNNSNLTSETEANGDTTSYSYDAYNNLTQSISPLGVYTNYTYNSNGLCNSVTIKNKAGTMVLSYSSTINSKGYTLATADENGYTDQYVYDESKGLLSTYTDKGGNNINYTYNTNNDLLTNIATTDGTNTVSNSYTYDDNNNLKTITHNGFDYRFNYDDFGNSSSIYVGVNRLVNNTYNSGNGKINKVSYENGNTESYDYNDLDLVTQLKYNNNLSFKWTYDSNGNIAKQEDIINKLLMSFEYDDSGKLIGTSTVDTSKSSTTDRSLYESSYGYDVNDNLVSAIYQANGTIVKHKYTYGQEDLLTQYTMPSTRIVTMAYDTINRLTSQTVSTDIPLQMSYIYWLSAAGNGNRTTQLKRETINGVEYSYTYDKLGNITEILKAGNPYAKYTYNALSELVRVDSAIENVSKVYTYDVGGNITSAKKYAYTTGTLGNVTSTVNYGYIDTTWKDKLTSYNGKVITYDNIGNPLTYGTDTTFTWKNGRELTNTTVNGNTVSYSYDSDGLRISKTVNGTSSNYYYDDGHIIYEKRGTKDIFYYYNADGQAVGLKYDGTNYYFTYNKMGDIIGIYSGSGTLKASYEYDEWGKLLSIKDGSGITITDSNNIGIVNPIRYRGYYYDTETGLYYLKSRYYSPEWGRFINADATVDTAQGILGANMFAYCLNNPVNLVDPNGELAEMAGGAGKVLTTILAIVYRIPYIGEVAIVITGITIIMLGVIITAKWLVDYAIKWAKKHPKSGKKERVKVKKKKTNSNGKKVPQTGKWVRVGKTLNQWKRDNNYTLEERNPINNKGVGSRSWDVFDSEGNLVGRVDSGHKVDGYWTPSHFHLNNNPLGNIHYYFD